jgi:hypothetical protein
MRLVPGACKMRGAGDAGGRLGGLDGEHVLQAHIREGLLLDLVGDLVDLGGLRSGRRTDGGAQGTLPGGGVDQRGDGVGDDLGNGGVGAAVQLVVVDVYALPALVDRPVAGDSVRKQRLAASPQPVPGASALGAGQAAASAAGERVVQLWPIPVRKQWLRVRGQWRAAAPRGPTVGGRRRGRGRAA